MLRLSRKELRDYFNSLEWERRKADHFSMAVFDFLMEASTSVSDHSIVLDPGAGQQRYKPFFNHARYVAVDFAKGDESWDYGRLDAVADIKALPIRSGSVDLIVNTSTLEHVNEPYLVIQEFYRVLKKDGLVFLYVPHVIPEHQQPYDFFRYTRFGLEYLFQKAGFTIDYIKPSNGVFYTSYIYLEYASGLFPIKYLRGILQHFLVPALKPIFCALDKRVKRGSFPILYLCKAKKE